MTWVILSVAAAIDADIVELNATRPIKKRMSRAVLGERRGRRASVETQRSGTNRRISAVATSIWRTAPVASASAAAGAVGPWSN